VTGNGGHCLNQPGVILRSIFRVAIGSDIDADDSTRAAPGGEPHMHGGRSLVVETQPIDDRLIALKAKQARSRIAGLGTWGNRSDLNETKAKSEQRVRNLRILVKACGKADGIRKFESEGTHGQFVRVGRRPREGHAPCLLYAKRVRVCGIESAQEGSRQAVEKTDQ